MRFLPALGALWFVLLSPTAQADERKIFLRDYLGNRLPEFQVALERGIELHSGVPGAGSGLYPFAEADLNGDGKDELLVGILTSVFSGSAGNYPIEIFARQADGEWRWLGRVWGRERQPLFLGQRSNSWATIRFEKHISCWRDLGEGEKPPETGYAGHVPHGGMYIYCSEAEQARQ